MLTDDEIVTIIKQEEVDAEHYGDDDSSLNALRATLLDYYNQELYGDEKDGKSSIVTAEVYQVVEGMIPPLMRMFLQNRKMAEFNPTRQETKAEKILRVNALQTKAQRGEIDPQELENVPEDIFQQEAEEKEALSNYVFSQEHDAENILYHLIKDGLLQITGWTQTYVDKSVKFDIKEASNLSEMEVEILKAEDGYKVTSKEENEDGTFNVVIERKHEEEKICIENVPPEEMVLSRRARDAKKPDLIGQMMLKTRSEIKAMNLASDDVIDSLNQDVSETNRVKFARHGVYNETSEELRQNQDRSLDKLWLRKYYMHIDVDQDGIAELYEFFYCDNVLLQKKRVSDHPFSLFCPVPISHKAIGTSPIAHMYKYQYWSSTLVRQMNNNIYTSNYPRYFVSSSVNLDDFYNPDSGQGVKVKGSTVGDAAQMIPVDNQVGAILQAMQYVESTIEKTTGVTAYNQGMDTESLNKTATGFNGIRDMSMMRTEVIARHLAVTIEDIYNKIVSLAGLNQNKKREIFVLGKQLTVNPKNWSDHARCVVDVGLGSGERQEAVQNLMFLLDQAKYAIQTGLLVADSVTFYNVLEKMAAKMGFKSIEGMFNDPKRPDQLLQAENEQLKQMAQQLEQALQQATQNDELAQAEKIRAEASLMKAKAELQNKGQDRMAKMALQRAEFDHENKQQAAKLNLEREKLAADSALKLTDIQARHAVNVRGDLIDG